MTLTQFLSTLKTKDVLVTVIDKDETDICKIYASGYAALESAIESRIIYKWDMTSAKAITVILDDVISA